MNAPDGHDARKLASGSHDDAAADRFAQNAIGRADVAVALGRNRRGFESDTVTPYSRSGVRHYAIIRGAPVLERQIEALESNLQSGDARVEDAQCFDQQFLSGLIAFEDDQRRCRQMNSPYN